jgi:hypothetical protein
MQLWDHAISTNRSRMAYASGNSKEVRISFDLSQGSYVRAQTRASAWVGGGKQTGLASDESKPFLQFLEDRVRHTGEMTGRPPPPC